GQKREQDASFRFHRSFSFKGFAENTFKTFSRFSHTVASVERCSSIALKRMHVASHDARW
ncbi:MAG: hypothetical protein KC584_11560, partial [Nitrospira sp.]|nr:hypothetical protein [Nitrospira sp.]